MFELQIVPALVVFFSGVIVGVLAVLLINKLRTGSVSAGSIKKEKDQYQEQVEAHFEETSKKFKNMAEQYKDLYQHLSVGATTLCRPENMATGLSDSSDPLKAIESKIDAQADDNADAKKDVKAQEAKPAKASENNKKASPESATAKAEQANKAANKTGNKADKTADSVAMEKTPAQDKVKSTEHKQAPKISDKETVKAKVSAGK